MAAIFTNFAYSTLATSITNAQTSLTVAAGHGARFPAPSGGNHFYATLESALLVREIVKVTARSTDTFTIVRAQDNTTANAFSAGVSVALRLNAAVFAELFPVNVGAAGQVLTSNGSTTPPTFQNASAAVFTPAFSVYISVDQTITASTWTKLALDAEDFDTTSAWNTGTHRFQPATAGYYMMSCVCDASASVAATSVTAGIYKNGAPNTYIGYSTGATSRVSGVAILYLNGSTDYAEFFGFVVASTARFSSTASYACSGCLLVGA